MARSRLATLASLLLVLGVVAAAPAAARVAADDTDEVVLPSRVATAIHRGQLLLDSATTAIDARDPVKAAAALTALSVNVTRADKAARAQMTPAAPPVDPEEEPDTEAATGGPDSVAAVLTFDQQVITTLTGLFDGRSGVVVTSLTHSLFATMNTRDKLLGVVIALPEEEGALYADGLADTAAGYDDEVANLGEALAIDRLSAGGVKVLTKGLAQSQKTQAAFAVAFGGGE